MKFGYGVCEVQQKSLGAEGEGVDWLLLNGVAWRVLSNVEDRLTQKTRQGRSTLIEECFDGDGTVGGVFCIRCLSDKSGCVGMKHGGPDNEELRYLITCTHQAASPPLRQHDRSYPCSIDSIKRFILTPASTGLFFWYNHGSQCSSPVGRIKRTLLLTAKCDFYLSSPLKTTFSEVLSCEP